MSIDDKLRPISIIKIRSKVDTKFDKLPELKRNTQPFLRYETSFFFFLQYICLYAQTRRQRVYQKQNVPIWVLKRMHPFIVFHFFFFFNLHKMGCSKVPTTPKKLTIVCEFCSCECHLPICRHLENVSINLLYRFCFHPIQPHLKFFFSIKADIFLLSQIYRPISLQYLYITQPSNVATIFIFGQQKSSLNIVANLSNTGSNSIRLKMIPDQSKSSCKGL